MGVSSLLLKKLEDYINQVYVESMYIAESLNMDVMSESKAVVHSKDSQVFEPLKSKKRKLEDVLGGVEASFSQMLMGLIDDRDMKDSEVYHKAGIDRKLFSKIRSNNNYRPSKNTVIRLAIGLELDFDRTQDLLAKSGYTLTRSKKEDIVVEYFIKEKRFNIMDLNDAMYDLLGISI